MLQASQSDLKLLMFLLPYKDKKPHLPPRKAGLIKLFLADLRNGEDDL